MGVSLAAPAQQTLSQQTNLLPVLMRSNKLQKAFFHALYALTETPSERLSVREVCDRAISPLGKSL